MSPDTHTSEPKFKTWQSVASIGFVLTLLVSLYIWTHVDADRVQRSVIVNAARIHELGLVLRQATDPDNTAFVTTETIQHDQSGDFVFAQDLAHPNVFVRKGVVAEPRSDGRIRILHGIRVGDQIVVNGAERLRLEPGSQLQAAETSGDKAIKQETK